ncbi:hypothetical protein DAEQUDRAFT_728801 [Daedalea quercina L-15889]|uniref:Uncharacterized protein n=1 Tax=Daedalea quercina L-15889 TaxID=1314783 RepID=A0A165NZV0_9APHY|nr:hypothetical protein DAEQUDRAFT_728801 [Daedalea quercina L-15889]
MPAQECNVHPPMFTDAMPVAAVIASCPLSESSARHCSMIARRRTDFPVPAEPVKKTLRPDITILRTSRCSSDSVIDGRLGATGRGVAFSFEFMSGNVRLRGGLR